MIGDTNLFFNDSQEPHIAEIEIMIADEACRGKKRGWESVILMMHYGNLDLIVTTSFNILSFILIYIYFAPGFETLNITKFRAKIKSDNVISIKMFENLGFQEVS